MNAYQNIKKYKPISSSIFVCSLQRFTTHFLFVGDSNVISFLLTPAVDVTVGATLTQKLILYKCQHQHVLYP